MQLDKVYIATAKLGQLTDTLDFTGTTIQNSPYEHITYDALRSAIAALGAGYHQIPPAYSALKFEGKHLSKIARTARLSAQQIDLIAKEKARNIKIFSCELIDFNPPYFTIQAHVSHGTYVRVMMNDIAKHVGTIATTHSLRRLAIGPFSAQDAIPLAQFKTPEDVIAACLNIEQAMDQLVNYQSQLLL